MTFKRLAVKVACMEGKKVAVNIAQISEVLACLAKIVQCSPDALIPLVQVPKKKRAK